MNKETHAEFMKLIEDMTSQTDDICYKYAQKIKEILDYDIRLELIKNTNGESSNHE
jgi:uncharacterized tellurite resistance protein B-like protein